MSAIRLEFTVEPFPWPTELEERSSASSSGETPESELGHNDGTNIAEVTEAETLGPHVAAALDVLRVAGFQPEVGPFGNTIEGEAQPLFDALGRATDAAFAAGGVAVNLSAHPVEPPGANLQEFFVAIRPLARAFGARLVELEDLTADDVPVRWKGRLVAGLRRTVGSDAQTDSMSRARLDLADAVSAIEDELGGTLGELSRHEKQQAVRLLDERGVFALRKAVNEIADAMGVSRVTVYNYLNAHRASDTPREPTVRPGENGTSLASGSGS